MLMAIAALGNMATACYAARTADHSDEKQSWARCIIDTLFDSNARDGQDDRMQNMLQVRKLTTMMSN